MSGIVSSEVIIDSLREEFSSMEIPTYKFRGLYSEDVHVFFDCEGGDEGYLEQVLSDVNHSRFVVFFVTREKDTGRTSVMDVSFPNMGKETLERFMKRYHSQLKPANVMIMEASGKEYVKYLGCSYE